jgi:DNA-binding CsgD family transcriptional regulator
MGLEGKYPKFPAKLDTKAVSEVRPLAKRDLEARVDAGKVSWPTFHEYLMRVSSCQTLQEFMRTACLEVQTLIPFDATANIFSVRDSADLGGIGPSEAAASFNSYYRYRLPPFGRDWKVAPEIVDWRGLGSFEFAVDFMWPNGCWKSLNHRPYPGQQIFLSIQRSRLSSDFDESDIDILGLVDRHLNSLYSSFDKRRVAPDSTLPFEGIPETFPLLSRREAEVCSLVLRRFNTAEIASCLFISRRTAEKHIENIFEKLGVRSRQQLRRQLGMAPSMRIQERQLGVDSRETNPLAGRR